MDGCTYICINVCMYEGIYILFMYLRMYVYQSTVYCTYQILSVQNLHINIPHNTCNVVRNKCKSMHQLVYVIQTDR